MKKLRRKKHYLGKIMNNISDKNIILIILFTILFVFLLIFSVRSPERKVIDSPIIWKEDFTKISYINPNKLNNIFLKDYSNKII